MKIRKITFEKHEIFGDLEIDFTNEGKTVNTIILAGENGVGKSLLLNTIFEFSFMGLTNEPRNEFRHFEVEFSDNEIEILKAKINPTVQNKMVFENNLCLITINKNIGANWTQISIKEKKSDGWSHPSFGTVFNDDQVKSILKTIFSDVEINFNSNEIKSVTALTIDEKNHKSQRSDINLPTKISQLFVDIQSLDAMEFSDWARNNPDKMIDMTKIDIRLRRFTSAFEMMFPLKKYKRIRTADSKKYVIFEEAGKEMSINKLSSGEKQIVFRGSFLLKDRESSKGALILVDEPEISLHPRWQLKILNFFKKLFTDENGIQTSQVIVTTHSPFIIHNSNRKDDKVIILQKDANGKISVATDPKFYDWNPEKLIEHAFNVSELFQNKTTTILVEGETDEKYFNKCIDLFDKKNLPMCFNWVGRKNSTGNAEFTGDNALNQTKVYITANPETIKHKVILLYDCDTNKPEEELGNLFIRCMTKNEENSIFSKGVENLLTLIPVIELEKYYTESFNADGYGGGNTKKTFNKTKFCEFVCDTLTPDKQKVVFAKLNSEIERLLLDQKIKIQ